MDRINSLKILAGYQVVSSKLPRQSKQLLLNFIQHESSEYQLKALLLDGKIIEEVDEISKGIIDDRVKLTEYFKILEESRRKTAMSILGFVLSPGSLIIYRSIRSLYDKCSYECGLVSFNTQKRQICLAKCNILRRTKELNLIRKINCKKYPNPEKCRIKKEKAIKEIQRKISKDKETIQKLAKKT